MNTAQKILFVCSRNRWRSLTAEKLFANLPGYQIRSAGTRADARIVVTEGHVQWADLIFVMQKSHLSLLRSKYPEVMLGKQVVNLLIPDDYTFMQPELIEELHSKVAEHIRLPEDLE